MLIYKDLRRIRSTEGEGVGREVCVLSEDRRLLSRTFFIQFCLTWIYISVMKCIFTWILTCAIFTKICPWSLSELWKTLFCSWKVKFELKKISSTLLYEMFPLCNLTAYKWHSFLNDFQNIFKIFENHFEVFCEY